MAHGLTAAMDAPKAEQRGADAPARARRRTFAIAILLLGAFCGGMGQTIVFSVLPPLAREMSLSEFQVGSIFMTAAIFWVLLGPQWGKASDKFGRKPFILIGLVGFAVSMFLFGWSIRLGLMGAIAGAPLFIIMLASRSLYGVVGSAGAPAAQAYIADRTSAKERTAGIASFSAAFGLGSMLGPGFGAAAAVLGPTAPFFAMAALAGVMSLSILYLPERTRPKQRARSAKVKITDARLRAFLIFGFVYGIINAIPVQSIGFYFLDALHISTELAPQLVGAALMGGAMASLFAQLLVVQRLRLPPKLLLRIAPGLIGAGHLLIWTAPFLGTVIFGMVIAGFGAGLAHPGYNAAASLAVSSDEQGAAMGLASAAGASGFIVAPLLGFSLYEMSPQAPYIFSTLLAAGLWIFALKSRTVGAAVPDSSAPTADEAAEKPASALYQ